MGNTKNVALRRQYQRDHHTRKQEWIDGIKSVPCAECGGIFPPVCMDFDHVRGEKLFTIGPGKRRKKTDVEAEIAKCDIVCANCHRKRTAERRK